jgi:predicted nucleotidyltransferase component of viral defense system
VRQRLLNQSQKLGEVFDLTLTRYAIERFLYRLTRSAYADQFVLKGAILFVVWTGQMYRPTRDVDLLGYGDSSVETLTRLFKEICAVEVEPDGLIFDVNTIQVEEIRQTQEYPGQRVRLQAHLGQARILLQIDVGFGDVITPTAPEVEYPSLLDFPAPRLRVYPKETVIAEKFQAMVVLGFINSRMKDFYDVWLMSKEFSFEGRLLAQAIQATFERRQTEIPQSSPVALTPDFGQNVDKQKQWRAFLKRNRADGHKEFAEIILELSNFLMPPIGALVNQIEFDQIWSAGGPWRA